MNVSKSLNKIQLDIVIESGCLKPLFNNIYVNKEMSGNIFLLIFFFYFFLFFYIFIFFYFLFIKFLVYVLNLLKIC